MNVLLNLMRLSLIMIELYEKVLSPELCNDLINVFDDSAKIERKMFDEVELPESELTLYLRNIITQVGNHYLSKHDPRQFTPKKYGIEGFRIKRYEPNIHSFPWHIDSAGGLRWLAFLIYLNDNEAGTEFENLTIPAKQGNIVVFPPFWNFPHQGQMPTVEPKYIMSTYYLNLRL